MTGFAARVPQRAWGAIVALAIELLSAATPACGQSAQKFAFQLSWLQTAVGVGVSSSGVSGYGVEPQLRLNGLLAGERHGSLSLGLGVQWSRHTAGVDKLTIGGVFFEPRWVMSGSVFGIYPYLSARLAWLNQSSNFGSSSTGTAVGVGFGLAYPVTKRINLDGGVAVMRQQFGDYELNDSAHTPASFNTLLTYAAKIGLSVGFPKAHD